MYQSLCILFLFSSAALAQTALIPSSQTLGKGGTEISYEANYFQTTGYLDTDGKKVSMPSGDAYSQMNNMANVLYGLTDRLELGLNYVYRLNQSTQTIAGTEYKLSAQGSESVRAQLKYSWPKNSTTQWAVEAAYRRMLFDNPTYSASSPSDITLGDIGQEFVAGLNISYQTLAHNVWMGRFLYRNPGDDLSSEIYSRIDCMLNWNSVYLGFGLENVASLKADAYGDDPANKPPVSSGATYLYNSVNREWTAPLATMGIKLGKSWRLEGEIKNVMAGSSTDLGMQYMLKIASRSPGQTNADKINKAYKEYAIEGTVIKISPKRSGVVVDIGAEKGVKEGMRVDFYHFDYDRGDDIIATGVVVKLGATKSVVRLTESFSRKRVEVGHTARSGIIKDIE